MQHPNQQNHPHSCQIKKTSTPTKKIAQKKPSHRWELKNQAFTPTKFFVAIFFL